MSADAPARYSSTALRQPKSLIDACSRGARRAATRAEMVLRLGRRARVVVRPGAGGANPAWSEIRSIVLPSEYRRSQACGPGPGIEQTALLWPRKS